MSQPVEEKELLLHIPYLLNKGAFYSTFSKISTKINNPLWVIPITILKSIQ